MGRPLSPSNAMFKDVTRDVKGCVYAVELGNGVVKVGYSGRPFNRMCALAKACLLDFGVSVVRFHVGPDLGRLYARDVERRLIARMQENAATLPGRAEFFDGVAFDVAARLVDEVSRSPTEPTTI